MSRARDLHALGVTQVNRGQPVLAVRTLRRVLDLIADGANQDTTTLRARVWLTMAYAESELYGLPASMRSLAEAERIAERLPRSALRILVLSQRGVMLFRAGKNDDALDALDAAVALVADVPDADRRDRGNLLLTRGTVNLFQGRYAAAHSDFAAAIALARDAGLRLEEHKARHNLGYLEFVRGDLPAALREMDAAAALGDDLPRGIPLLDRARVLIEAGLLRAADEALAEAGTIFARHRLTQDVAEVELARAECALLSGDAQAARRFGVRSRDRFHRRGNERWRRRAELMVLQADVARCRIGGAVEERGRRLVADLLAEGLGAQSRTAAFVTADALLVRGRVEEARAVADSVAPAGRSDPFSARLYTRYLRGRLARSSGDYRQVRRHARAGLRELAGYQARFGSIDLQTAASLHGRRLAELGIAAALDDGRPSEVFAASEWGRAVSSRLPPVRPPADEGTAELLAELRRVVEDQRAAAGPAARTLQQQRRRLEKRITAQSWTLAGSGAASRVAGLAEIRAAAAAAGSTVVSFVRADADLHAVVVGRDQVAVRSLGTAAPIDALARRVRADLDVLAYRRLPSGLRAAASGSLRHSLAGLDDALLRGLRVPGRLVVIPTGILGALPWGLLPSGRGVPVTVAPSATAWIGAAGPDEGVVSVAALAGPGLERSGGEVGALARVWPGATTNTTATRLELIDALAQASIVHVAAHGQHQTENPLFSSIRLADGPLFAYELDRAAPHVILSACELGLATIRPGDEALGLTSVLLRLGTRSVIAGVARVDDDIAAEVMAAYHRELAAGHDSAEALAAALPDRLDPPAPFGCFGGDWRYSNGD